MRTHSSGSWNGRRSKMQLDYHRTKNHLLDQFEKTWLIMMSREHGCNMSQVAKAGNVDRTTVYRIMEKHGLTRDHLMLLALIEL